MSENNNLSKIIHLAFPPEISGRPVICNLGKLFDLSFNILKSDINPRQEGSMTLEISGTEEEFQTGINYLKENGVSLIPVASKIARDEDSCMHCGMCLAMCPTGALSLDMDTRLVMFDLEKCTACGRCTKICPVRAMIIDPQDDNGIA
ncbi:NIL domain-containing protein [Maridesulfovibrio bastinii]|jgi:ferredoxin|uniref:NIL domain-containing protein n=1 Tax=Maridesulfovibrio bastinii TaxID=47157 RepID=UPI0003F94C72|nr:NIL domain-containing protein [Maridesulfovibrio bastinii]